jgi:hypothetical protein
MDWFSGWEPMPYLELDAVDPPSSAGALTAWFIVTVIVLTAAVAWSRQRVVRHSFWCATSGRDVEVRFRRGCIVTCSAFEDPTAIACTRGCRDRSFRTQWPPIFPLLKRGRRCVNT